VFTTRPYGVREQSKNSRTYVHFCRPSSNEMGPAEWIYAFRYHSAVHFRAYVSCFTYARANDWSDASHLVSTGRHVPVIRQDPWVVAARTPPFKLARSPEYRAVQFSYLFLAVPDFARARR
jgi:hypothetical protein